MSLAQATKSVFSLRGEKWRAGAASEYWLFGEDILSEIITKVDPNKGADPNNPRFQPDDDEGDGFDN